MIEQFRARGATSTTAARTLDAIGILDDRTFQHLRNRGIVREGAPGTFYLDEVALEARAQARRRLRPFLLALAVVLALVAVVLVTLQSRGAT